MSARPTTIDGARRQVGPELRIVGVIGSPVAHSLSPVLHNAAFAALGLAGRWRSFAFEVPVGEAAGALEAVRRADVSGLSVTMPHKAAVAALVDECSEVARRLDAVNCVVNRGGWLYGTNTDGEGFVASLARGVGFDPAGRRCLVVGAGGAARAVVVALAEAGAAEISILNRHRARAEAALSLAGGAGRVGEPSDLAGAELVVQATSVGLGDGRAVHPLVDTGVLHGGQTVVDLVYHPPRTALLAAAEAAGATIANGLGMLVHQAALAVERWTGRPAPVEAMWKAVSSR